VQQDPFPVTKEFPHQNISKRKNVIDLMKKKSSGIFKRRASKSKRTDEVNCMKEDQKSIESLLKQVTQDPRKLVPGAYHPFIESTIIRELKNIAFCHTKQRLYEESQLILHQVIKCERLSLGRNHPQVANTLYHIAVNLNFLGDSEKALSTLQEGIHILFPRRFKVDNMDLAALFYQYGVIEGSRGNYQSALYHLDLAGQVETNLLGRCTEKTLKKTADYKYTQMASKNLNQTSSKTA